MKDIDDFTITEEKDLSILDRLNKQRVLNAYRDKEDYEWGWVLYPSGMNWGMCVADHVYNKVSKNKNTFGISELGEERMSLGTLRHEEWQKLILDTRLLYGKPKYPRFIKDKIKAKNRRKRQYPEIYAYCPYWGISGWADSVIKDKGKPWIVDFKTKNDHPIEDWEEKKQTFPAISEETQCYIYAVIFDKYKYFKDKIAGIRLIYYNNPCFHHKKIAPGYEYKAEINEEKYQKTIDLLDEARLQVLRYFCQMPFKCEYRWCEKHGSSKDIVIQAKA